MDSNRFPSSSHFTPRHLWTRAAINNIKKRKKRPKRETDDNLSLVVFFHWIKFPFIRFFLVWLLDFPVELSFTVHADTTSLYFVYLFLLVCSTIIDQRTVTRLVVIFYDVRQVYEACLLLLFLPLNKSRAVESWIEVAFVFSNRKKYAKTIYQGDTRKYVDDKKSIRTRCVCVIISPTPGRVSFILVLRLSRVLAVQWNLIWSWWTGVMRDNCNGKNLSHASTNNQLQCDSNCV